jgi:hypothetical protein
VRKDKKKSNCCLSSELNPAVGIVIVSVGGILADNDYFALLPSLGTGVGVVFNCAA